MDKSPDAFRTISEVGDDLDVPQHVLRFWETRFREIKPMKRGGGRRYYRPEDVALLRGIRHLLYGEGYTIRGVQRILRDQGARFVQGVWEPGAPQPSHTALEAERAASTEHDVEDRVEGGDLLDPVPASPVMRRELVKQETARAPVARGLTRDDQRQLQSALHELGECKRMLESALTETAG